MSRVVGCEVVVVGGEASVAEEYADEVNDGKVDRDVDEAARRPLVLPSELAPSKNTRWWLWLRLPETGRIVLSGEASGLVSSAEVNMPPYEIDDSGGEPSPVISSLLLELILFVVLLVVTVKSS